jgi:hypothetical protein
MDTNPILHIVYAILIAAGFITMMWSWASSEGERISNEQRKFYGRTFLAGAGLICVTVVYIYPVALGAIITIALLVGLAWFITNYHINKDTEERRRIDSAIITRCHAAITEINQRNKVTKG